MKNINIYRFLIGSVMIAMMIACGNKNNSDAESHAGTEVNKGQNASPDELFMLVGTYTSPEGSQGIYTYRFNLLTGSADSIGLVEVSNPSYLVLSPDEQFVYAVGEEDKEEECQAYAFSFDSQSGLLSKINSQQTGGAAPCYIVMDPLGKSVQTANYLGGSISSFGVQEDGSLTALESLISFEGSGVDLTRQEAPHVHSVRYSPDKQYLFASDLGSDKLYRFSFNADPKEGETHLSQNSLHEFIMPAGTGPRHFDFHPNGQYLYLLGELSGEVIIYDYHQGNLVQKQTIAADTLGAHGSADIHVSPDGRFLYASNRLIGDGIAIFAINPDDGSLTHIAYQATGLHPRNFNITPNGDFLLVACRDDNKIQVFKRSHETGILTDTKQDILLDKPVCVKFATIEANKEEN